MGANLQPVAAALAHFSNGELAALIATGRVFPTHDPARLALLAWIDHIADWEVHRRDGLDFPLPLPAAAIPPGDEGAAGIIATRLRWLFAEDAPAVAALFAAIVATLTRSATQH